MVQLTPINTNTTDLTQEPTACASGMHNHTHTHEPKTQAPNQMPNKASLIQQAPHLMFGSVIDRATTMVDALPSKFLSYPPGTKVYYRPYTYKDLDDFNDSSIDLLNRLRFILKGITCQGMEPEQLTLGDFLFIGLYRRISSLGTHHFQIKITRDGGAFKTSKSFSFEDIGFNEIEAPALPITATIGGVELQFMPLTIGRFLEILEKDILPGSKDYERASLAAQVININFEDAYEIISNAFGSDLVTLNQVDGYLSHSVQPLSVTYNYNGELVTEQVPLDDPLTLIYPFCRPEDVKRDTIRFGI